MGSLFKRSQRTARNGSTRVLEISGLSAKEQKRLPNELSDML